MVYFVIKYFDQKTFYSNSVAIMSYIANKNKDKVVDHWFPKANIQQQAKFEEFMNWQQMNIRKPRIDVFLNTVSICM